MIDFTPALRLYAKRRNRVLARQNTGEAQSNTLLKLVRYSIDTQFGRDHDFASIRNIADYQARVRLRKYEDFWMEYWQEPFPHHTNITWPGTLKFFSTTSGTTTGYSKYIPFSPATNRSNAQAGVDLLVHHVTNRPQSRVFGGKSFLLGSSTALVEEASGIFAGDLSGITDKQLPTWFKHFRFPPAEITEMVDWEEKLTLLAELAPKVDIRALSGTPSWVKLLFEYQQELAGQAITAAELYPNLEMLVHGGVNFKPYRQQFEAFLAGRAETREVYPASEGFIAVQDRGPDDGLRLIIDNGLFFEFVPVDDLESNSPSRHTVEAAEIGVNYAIIVTNCAGCWSYIIGDIVRFVSKDPPRITISGRISQTLSAFGEHVIGEELEAAVTTAAEHVGMTVSDFSVGAVVADKAGELGHHLYIIEFDGPGLSELQVADVVGKIDAEMIAGNNDYRVHRADGFGIKMPKIIVAPKGTFTAWMKARGRLGGQNKVPRIINDPETLASLVTMARKDP